MPRTSGASVACMNASQRGATNSAVESALWRSQTSSGLLLHEGTPYAEALSEVESITPCAHSLAALKVSQCAGSEQRSPLERETAVENKFRSNFKMLDM